MANTESISLRNISVAGEEEEKVADKPNEDKSGENPKTSQEADLGGSDTRPRGDEEATAAAPQHLSGIRFHLAVATLCLGVFLTVLDNTIIATAAPYISDEFHSLDDVGWYSSSYTMAVCVSQLLFGKLAARYSIRWIHSIAMFLFLVGSAVCGSAPNSPALIIGRVIAGTGCAGLLVAAFSLVPFIAPPAKRPAVLGLFSAVRGLATTFGPLIGGALTEKVSWRWIFYINLPIGAAIQAAFFLCVHPPKRDSESFTSWVDFLQTLDLFGLAALLPAIVCLLLALQWGGIQYPWTDARVLVLLVLSGVLGVVFICIEVRQGDMAVLPTRVFTQRTVSSASFFGFATTGAIFVLTYYLPIWFQGVKGASPIQSGVWTLPWVITSTITSLSCGVLISKVGYADVFMVVGSIFGAVGSGLFTTFTLDTSTGKWIGYQIIFAICSSLAGLTPLIVAQHALPLKDVPIGSGMVMFTQMIGASIFVSVAQALFTNGLTSGLKDIGMAGLDASTISSGGITTLADGLSGSAKRAMLVVINHALTQSWQLAVVLSCISIIGALAVEHGELRKRN